MARATTPKDERGQASVDLVAVLPALLLVAAIAIQLGITGWSLWSATEAARAGARAQLVGADAAEAARAALPGVLREGAAVAVADSGLVDVEVTAPVLVPGVQGFAVSGSAGLDPAAGS